MTSPYRDRKHEYLSNKLTLTLFNYVQDVFRKLSGDSNPPITVKQEQEEAVNSLINGKKGLRHHANWF